MQEETIDSQHAQNAEPAASSPSTSETPSSDTSESKSLTTILLGPGETLDEIRSRKGWTQPEQ